MQILQYAEITSFNLILGIIIVGIGLILGVVLYIKTYNLTILTMCVSICCVIGTIGGIRYPISTGEIKYQVKLDNQITASEFLKNYEIISKENDTYWIRKAD